jgi:hypothetical protein
VSEYAAHADDARIPTLRLRGIDDQWHRAGSEIQKEQFKAGKLDGRSATPPQQRTPVLAARIAFLREVSNPAENSSGREGAAGAPTVSVQDHHQHPDALDESPTQPRTRKKKLSG